MQPETCTFMEHFLNAEESPSPLQIMNNGIIYYLGFIIVKSALCQSLSAPKIPLLLPLPAWIWSMAENSFHTE